MNGYITKEECDMRLARFKNKHAIMLFIENDNRLLWIKPTDTGDNLTAEDLAEGNNDYLYCENMRYLGNGEYTELTDEDAPMVFFNNEVKTWNEDIALAVFDTLTADYPEAPDGYCVSFIPLFAE